MPITRVLTLLRRAACETDRWPHLTLSPPTPPCFLNRPRHLVHFAASAEESIRLLPALPPSVQRVPLPRSRPLSASAAGSSPGLGLPSAKGPRPPRGDAWVPLGFVKLVGFPSLAFLKQVASGEQRNLRGSCSMSESRSAGQPYPIPVQPHATDATGPSRGPTSAASWRSKFFLRILFFQAQFRC